MCIFYERFIAYNYYNYSNLLELTQINYLHNKIQLVLN